MPNLTPNAADPRTDDPFTRLVDRDLDRVWRFLRSLVRDPDLARDLCHDTFLRLRRALHEGRVRRLEAGLDDDHRAVFVLSELEGLRYEEIAEALGVPVGTVASRKHAATRRMRRTLEEMGHAL